MILGEKIAHVGFCASKLVVCILDPHGLDYATWSKLSNLSVLQFLCRQIAPPT